MTAQTGPPNLISLTIESSVGSISKTYNENEPIKAVKTSAMAELHIDPSTAEKYGLFLSGNRLADDQTLKQASVPIGATLVLTLLSATVV